MARLVTLIAVAALAVTPATALAVTNPFLPQEAPPPQEAPAQQQAPAQAPASARNEPNGGINSGELSLLGIGAIALIAGIWLIIVRDARRATGGRARPSDPAAPSRPTRAAPRGRKLSPAERRRRKRGRAR